MKNIIGFIPKTAAIQPAFYREIFAGWTAVFITDEDEEYHIQINADYFHPQHGKDISVLKQHPTHRTEISAESFSTIKAAVDFLAPIIAAKMRKSQKKRAS